MTDNILKYGTFILFFGSLSRKHFELAPIWCEYYEPSELDDIDLSDDWLQINLFNRLDSSNQRAYYSILDNIDYSKREFLSIFSELSMGGDQLQGYLYVIQGSVNSISIFIGNEVVDLYSSDLLSKDNLKTLNDISAYLQVSLENVNTVEYTIKNCFVNTIESMGVFQFPVE